jgi:hypothetical protein
MARSIIGERLRRRAAMRRPEAKLARWKGIRGAGLAILVLGSAFMALPFVLPFSFLSLLLLGLGIPLFILGLIFVIPFTIKIDRVKQLLPKNPVQEGQAATRNVATRIPRAARGIEQEQVDKLKALFKVSERVKIDDIASMLGTTRKDVFDKLLVLSKTVTFQINEDVVVIDKGQSETLINELDRQFSDWGKKEVKKTGKI